MRKNTRLRLAATKNAEAPQEGPAKPALKLVPPDPAPVAQEFQPDAFELEARNPP